MYKVYLSDTFTRDLAQRVCSALPKDLYICCGDEFKDLYPGHEN